MTYLEEMLESQRVDGAIEDALRARRAAVEQILGGWPDGEPRFYYGGSFGKRTMIAAHFDLDVVVYFPPHTNDPPRALYAAVERRLRDAGHTPVRHNVSLRLRYTPGWHVDVVPGRALDDTYRYADLYAAEVDATRQTSLKVHIELARSGDRDTLKVLKLWRWRNAVPVGSFILELAAARALRDSDGATLEDRVERVLRFLADEYVDARLVDPANSNNVVSDDVHFLQKSPVADAARAALDAGRWERIVW
jgi:hypothetical protein